MQPGAQFSVKGDKRLAMPSLVAKHAAWLDTIRNLVDQIVGARNVEALNVIRLMEQSLLKERITLEKLIADFRAGIDGTPVSDPLTCQLIDARAHLMMTGIDQMLATLRPRLAVVTAFDAPSAELRDLP
jgi:hypothetical protein